MFRIKPNLSSKFVFKLIVTLMLFLQFIQTPSKAASDYLVTTFSGINGSDANKEIGEAGTTSMAPDGTLYIADRHLFAVRKFKNGQFSDFIKSGRVWNGKSAVPCGVFVRSLNEVYVSYCDLRSVDLFDSNGRLVRTYSVNVGITDMGFDWGGGLAVNQQGDIFLSEEQNQIVIRIDGTSGVSEIYAGVPTVRGMINGDRKISTFNVPRGLLIDKEGSLLIADTYSNAIRKIDKQGNVTTLTSLKCSPMGLDQDSKGFIYVVGERGCGAYIFKVGEGAIFDDSQKSVDCSVPTCIIGQPFFAANSTISIDRFGNQPSDDIFIADWANHNLHRFSKNGEHLQTYGGKSGWGVTNQSKGTENQIYNFPHKTFAIEDGTYLVVDNNSVRHLSSNGEVIKVTLLTKDCWYSNGIAITPDGTLFCSSWNKITVRFSDGQTMYIGSGISNHRDGIASTSAFQSVNGMSVWKDDLYVAEGTQSGFIRKVSRIPGSRDFQVTTVLGSGNPGRPTDVMSRQETVLEYPNGIAFDLAGNLFIAGGNSYLWKTDLNPKSPVTRIPGNFEGSWNMAVATDKTGAAYVSTEFGSIFRADSVIERITREAKGSKNGPASQATFYQPRVSFVDKNGALLISDALGNLIRKMQVSDGPGHGILTTDSVRSFINSENSSNGTPSSSNISFKIKPDTPTFNKVIFKGNSVNIQVNLGNSPSRRSEKIYLVAPKLGIDQNEPLIGKITEGIASWTLNIDKLLSGKMIPLEIVGEKDGVRSDLLTGAYQAPSKELITNVPAQPTKYSSRIVGSSAIVTVNVIQRTNSRASNVYLYSKSLKISKNKPLIGDLQDGKAIIEVPFNKSMEGKNFPISIFLSNSKGESKPLNVLLKIPQSTNVTKSPTVIEVPKSPKMVFCTRANQTRTFEGEACPPGWNKR